MIKSILSSGKKRPQYWRKHIRKVWEKKTWIKWRRRGIYFGSGMVLTAGLLVGGFYLYFADRAFPGVKVADRDVSSQPAAAITALLTQEVQKFKAGGPVPVTYKSRVWEIDPTKVEYDIPETVQAAISSGKDAALWQQWLTIARIPDGGVQIPMQTVVETGWLETVTATIAGELNVEHVPPTITLLPYPDPETGSLIAIEAGVRGQQVDTDQLSEMIRSRVNNLHAEAVSVPMNVTEMALTDEMIDETRLFAEGLINKTLVLTYESEGEENRTWELTDEDLIHLIEVGNGFSREKIAAYVEAAAQVVNRPAQNARFSFNTETGRVEEFAAAKPGLEVDVSESTEKIRRVLSLLAKQAEVEPVLLAVSTAQPEVTLESVNDMGIKTLLGRGVSTYYGSIPTRVHNIDLAASRVTGTLVKPGEVYSFNEAVGEISKATGYQEAYVIFEGRTELGDGGGVCQDSTTVFRAALDAGLPIVERKPHSYRVGYYEQDTKAGIDATVYPPYADLKFLNDTPAHILIQATADTPNRTLVVEIYGTSDGRKSEIKNHSVWGITPPPPTVYTDDPTLPKGEEKQIEKAVAGAKAQFDYVVTRDGETLIEETFYSNYKPWAAVYLRGTKEE